MGYRASWIVGVVLLAGGCDEVDEVGFDDIEEVELRAAADNSMYLNSLYLNSLYLNGSYLNGSYLNSPVGPAQYVRATEFKFNGGEPQAVWLEGSQLFVKDDLGAVFSGTDMNKLKVKYDVKENGVVKKKVLKINHATRLAPDSDVWLYDIHIKDGGTSDWTPLCLDGAGNPTQAILLSDLWNPTSGDRLTDQTAAMTYACRGAALAKCVEWGYKPWAMASGTSLSEFHQACSRMVRADYCGTGTSHTVTGTPIHVLDEEGVQKIDPVAKYVVEAEWSPEGATCLNAANTRLADQSIECSLPACGESFSSGGIIQSGKITGTK
ncbi:MAG: hypothetical protein JNL82_25935 [Myxococcales bacterium]|nr:hypothetical protein [Myxococcales bacterium]